MIDRTNHRRVSFGSFPLLVFLLVGGSSCFAADDVIFDMDSVQHHPSEINDKNQHKAPCGAAELVEGKFGKAVKFTFVENAVGGFMAGRVRPTPAWDKSAGFSFWVKGDGSPHYAGIELIDPENFGLRYGYCFPIDSTDWKKITVSWKNVIPELAGPLVDARKGYAPSKFGNFWFGKWFYWRSFPAESFTIDQVVLEPTIEEAPVEAHSGLKRVRQKLGAHQPITIVTMGDSLSDKHHWSNQDFLWSELLADALKSKYHSDVKLVNPSVGGTTLSQNLITMPKWEKQAPEPDLVIVWFGGNDWDTGVRGPRFREYVERGVDLIRARTKGSADILLLTPCPTHDRWDTYAEMEQAVKEVAQSKRTALADVAADFRKATSPDQALKEEYWAWDKVHLGLKGKEVTRDAILKALAEEGADSR